MRTSRYIGYCMILVMLSCSLTAQKIPAGPGELYNKYWKAGTETAKTEACLALTHHYLFKGNVLESDLDSAWIFLQEAKPSASRLQGNDLTMATTSLLGNYYVIRGQWARGHRLSKTAIDYYHTEKKYVKEAESWKQLGKSIIDSNNYFAQQKLESFEKARHLFIQAGLTLQTAETLLDIAICNARQKRFDTAEHMIRQVITMYRPLDKEKMLEAYHRLAELSEYQTDPHKQLKYRLELMKEMEAVGDTSNAAFYYAKLAATYAHAEMYRESLAYILKAIDILIRNKQYDDLYGDLSLAIFDYIKMGKPETALAYLRKKSKEVPPQDLAHSVDLNDMLGKCYAAMKDYAAAEKYYLEMMRLFSVTQKSNLYSTHEQKITDFIHYHQVIGDFYITTGQYKKAGFYFDKILALPPGNIRPINLSKVHLMQFKVDSASNNFIAAIRHYQQYKQMEDSLFNLAKNQQIHELNIKYETEKQSKDLQIKQQNISALTTQTRLQQADLKSASFARNVIIISSIVLLALAYVGYRVKQRHNLQLQQQQQEINTQNNRLRQLLSAQEKLLHEKEWLLKEVHHRVKNNLHTIISLLETQANFLTDDALAAIQNSQHRVYAMSLIHQKLYQFENSTSINMGVYLPDLLQYLQDSFDVPGGIHFETDFEEIELDITQAIPIGLIFNEAITNSIKYAFPAAMGGTIKTSMKLLEDGNIRLLIEDNGIGLPPNWEKSVNNSLGLKLMRGLSGDIQASFNIEANNGTRVIIEFKKLPFLKPFPQQELGSTTTVDGSISAKEHNKIRAYSSYQ